MFTDFAYLPYLTSLQICLKKARALAAWVFPSTNPNDFLQVALATLQRVVSADQQVMQRHRNTIIDAGQICCL